MKIRRILAPTEAHKFCWFNGAPAWVPEMTRLSGTACYCPACQPLEQSRNR